MGPTRQSTPTALNAYNRALRAQPWYQQWFAAQGLNPEAAHLSDAQRRDLAATLESHGLPLTGGMNIDPAGNINRPHGFASQPGWLKALEIGGVAAAGGWAAGGFLGAAGGPSAAAATGPTTATGTTATASALAASGGASLWSRLLLGSLPILATTAGTLYGQKAQTVAAQRAAELEAASAKYAADLQAQGARDALAFARQQATQGQANFITAQNASYDQWRAQQAQMQTNCITAQNASYDQWRAQQDRLAPYRAYGQGAATQLGSLLGVTPAAIPAPPSAPTWSTIPPPAPPTWQTTSFDQGPTASPTVSPQTSVGATVRLRAPDGSVRDVPQADVAHYLSRGAQLVAP